VGGVVVVVAVVVYVCPEYEGGVVVGRTEVDGVRVEVDVGTDVLIIAEGVVLYV
jgi:hypothetical protein